MAPKRFHVETLGCPKNSVDSDKVVASLLADGMVPAASAEAADLVVVNTCAFIEAARQESIDTILDLAERRRPGARLVATGCMAERYGEELAAELPELDAVVGFAGEGSLASLTLDAPSLRRKGSSPIGVRDLLELPRPGPAAPWAYVKIAEGCDRACAFCAIPSFRGKQRSRLSESIEAESRSLVERGAVELVLVAQDLAWYGRDIGEAGALVPLLQRLDGLRDQGLERLRLLYLYPSEVRAGLIDAMLELPSVVPYFDLSLQHAAPGLLRRMKRWGSGARFLATIEAIRERQPDATFRSSFICGFPGETEADHEVLLRFLGEADLDWAGFFPFSPEDGTPAASMDETVPDDVMRERLRELAEVQEPITDAHRRGLVGTDIDVIVDEVEGDEIVARSHREAPEIDGVVRISGIEFARPGARVTVRVVDAAGPDLEAEPVNAEVRA